MTTGIIKTKSENLVYENNYVKVYDDDVEFPDGHLGKYFRSRWTSPFGVAIIVVANDVILLVRNYRYQEKSFSVEVPQGFGVEGSTPAENARRELYEETGIHATSLESLFSCGKEYETHVFAHYLDSFDEVSCINKERSEAIESFVYLPVRDIDVTMFQNLEIHDPLTIACCLFVKTIKDCG